MAYLPPELLLGVASLTRPGDYNDLASLHRAHLAYRNLISVCRLFHSELLHHLFECVSVEDGKPNYKEAGQERIGLDPCATNRSFFVAINNGDEHALLLAQHVRRCTFINHGPVFHDGALHHFDPVYTTAVRRMENITHFTLVNGLFNDDMLNMILHFPRLTSLKLVGGVIDGITQPDLLLTLQHISHLELYNTDHNLIVRNTLNSCQWDLTKLGVPLGTAVQLDNICQSCALQELIIAVMSIPGDLDVLIPVLDSTPTITRLSINKIHLRFTPDDAHPLPTIQLSPNALPALRSLCCPANWIQYLVPGRPLQEIDIRPVYAHFPTDFHNRPELLTGLEGTTGGLLYLQESTAKIERLAMFSRDYQLHVTGQAFRSQLGITSLELNTLSEGVQGPFLDALVKRAEDGTAELMPMDEIRGGMEILSRHPSPTVRHLRAPDILEPSLSLNLPLQLQVISILSSMFFPSARLIQVSKWIEWRLVYGEQTGLSDAPPQWKPFLTFQGGFGFGHSGYTYQSFLRTLQYLHRRQETAVEDDPSLVAPETRAKVVDYDGFFEGFLNRPIVQVGQD